MSQTSPWILGLLFSGSTAIGLASYGLGSLIVFAGPRAALKALWDNQSTGLPWYQRLHWGTVLHMPFVGPVLVINRLLRLLGYFTTSNLIGYTLGARLVPSKELTRWPPSPWWVMAFWPTIGNMYNLVYRELFSNLEKKLDRQLRAIDRARNGCRSSNQQATAQTTDDVPDADAAERGGNLVAADGEVPEGHPNIQDAPVQAAPERNRAGIANAIMDFLRDEGWEAVPDEELDQGAERQDPAGRRGRPRRIRQHIGNDLENVRINVVVEENEDDGNVPGLVAEEGGVNAVEAAIHEDVNVGGRNGEAVRAPRNNENDREGDRRDAPLLIDVINSLVRTLMLPGISFATGELLRLCLPQSWAQRPPGLAPTGLLQEQWGRSLVGGCLYVVFRDLFRLYVKHRKAKILPSTKIMEYRGRRRGT